MKINAINNYTFYTQQSPKLTNPLKPNNQNKRFDYSLSEVFGRSQVNFTGDKYQQYDKMFVDTVAKNLRLSDDERKRLSIDVNEFLRINHYHSLEDIRGLHNSDKQEAFGNMLCEKICKSDFDSIILVNTITERMYYDDEYEPTVNLYAKDYEIVDNILDKYDYNANKKRDIFDVMRMEAERLKCKDIFEPLMQENYPKRFQYLLNKFLDIDEESSTDLLIDFGLMATKNDAERRADIYPWKLSSEINKYIKDREIATKIIMECDLIDDNCLDDKQMEITINNVTDYLEKRRNGISPEQIAYELMEKYDIPIESYDFIRSIIYLYDTGKIPED